MKTTIFTHEINTYPENDFEGYREAVAKDIGAGVFEAEAKEQEWFDQYEARTKAAMAYAKILEDVHKMIEASKTSVKPEICEKIPLWKKPYLTIKEAAVYFGVGETKLSSIVKDFEERNKAEYIMKIGVKRVVKRIKFEQFLNAQFSI